MALSPQEFEKLKLQLSLNKSVVSAQPKQPGLISRISSDIKQRGENIVSTLADDSKSPLRRGVEATTEAFNAIPATALNVAPQPVREASDYVGKKITDQFTNLTNKIGESERLQQWVLQNPDAAQKLEGVLSTTAAGGAIAGDILFANEAVRIPTKVTSKVQEATNNILSKSKRLAGDKKLTDKVTEFMSKDVDGKAETILRETPTSKLDEYIKYGEEAAKDPRKFTPFDYVGDRMEQATKLLKDEMKKVGQAKSEFTKPLRQGFDAFEGKSLADDLTSLHNRLPASDRGFLKPFIEKARNVKTKYQADQLIDEIQDAVSTAGAQNIIPRGSSLQRQLGGIVEKFNAELKAVLPKEYAQLNARYANLKNVTRALNKALGEVVDGQSTRGSSLVKQFFSPSGKTAKVVFDFVKQNTGIDLAQETTLARFAMELFDDPRARSLLEGIPKSTSGLIDKTIDLIVDKTGTGKKLQQSLRNAEIRKAKQLTQ